MTPRLLTIAEVSEMTRVPAATLRYWRWKGDAGPQSFKMGPKRVVYREADVLAWIEEQRRRASAEVS